MRAFEEAAARMFEKLPEETSLQRKMKAYVLQGGKIGEAYGEIPKQH